RPPSQLDDIPRSVGRWFLPGMIPDRVGGVAADFCLKENHMSVQPPVSTTEGGAPAPSDAFSLTVGADGPILLHDHHFIQQMAHFNRERVPERNVHAKGGGAFGFFEVTDDVSAFTKAAVFQPGTTTETLLRLSTVAGEQGS